MGVIGGYSVQRKVDIYGEWVKLFRHNTVNNEYFSSFNDWEEARLSNPSNNESNKYSILSYWNRFLRNGVYTLKLDYPDLSITNIWSQTNDPTQSGQEVVQNYTPIDIGSDSNFWGGLEKDNSPTFLDGSVNHSNWYYAIASSTSWNDGVLGTGSVANLIELWILDKPY